MRVVVLPLLMLLLLVGLWWWRLWRWWVAEFRETSLVLSAKNEKVVAEGMVFNVALGLQGLKNEASEDPKTRDYALLLADTVVVTKGAAEGEKPSERPVATSLCTKQLSDISYSLRVHPPPARLPPSASLPLFWRPPVI